MTTTNATSGTTNTTNTSSSNASNVAAASSQQLAGNFNTFLTLLTTQLQNQNPLDPLDTNQFTQQLVEFSGVEQQINMNSNLQTLITLQQTSEATSAMQFLGSNVTLSGTTATLTSSTSPATWSLNSASPATAKVTITNSSGQTAYTGTVSLNSGAQSYSWNGLGNNGISWPAGQYTMAISATSASGQPVTVNTQIQGTVSNIDTSQSPPQVTVNGQSYPISAIQSINSGTSQAVTSLNTSIGNLNTAISNLTQLF
ncbi:MAG TPA: flagellar hook capping FlgD N-terminal domain-containing protein [Xanthobacteraceae bacterium]|jgi:flagellar basal-body rod modification protein FlgD|nr:flagellar hook capping FlgD N-terminal domain-containing protein [Xanthobacteraceae bacterium]